jgi:hypothetical protein
VLLARQGDPQFAQWGTYCVQSFQPYHIFHHLTALIYKLFGAFWVSRVMLGLVYVFYVVSVFVFLRAFKAAIPLVGLAIPLFFGFLYQLGFGPNILGLPLYLLGLVAAQWWCSKPTLLRGCLLLGSCLLTWLSHPVPFYSLLSSVAIFFVIECRNHWLKLLKGYVWLLAPSIISLLYIKDISTYNPDILTPTIAEPTVWQKLWWIPHYLMGIAHNSPIEIACSVVYLVGLLGIFFVSWNQFRAQTHNHTWAYIAVVIWVFLLYLATANFMMRVHFVHQRFLIFSALLIFWLIPAFSHRWSKRFYLLAWMASIIFLLHNVSIHWQWRQQMRDIYILAPAKNISLITLVPPLQNRLTREVLLRNVGLEIQLHRGGIVRPSFTHYPHMPVVDCEIHIQNELHHKGVAQQPWNFSPSTMSHFAEYLLIYMLPDARDNYRIYPWLLQKDSRYKPVSISGSWMLWRRISHTSTK